jgi:hypothetical protein
MRPRVELRRARIEIAESKSPEDFPGAFVALDFCGS